MGPSRCPIGIRTGSTGDTEPTAGVSNQESVPLPVISSEDTIYVLIDTDNDFLTGYSSIGMPIGAEEMVEIKGHYGIITQRVIKEWTGSEPGDWEWSTGEIIDAAASGSEIELEVVDGNFWIHIVGWNGDQDSSLSFSTLNDLSRYITNGHTEGYWSFNTNLNDASGNNLHFTANGCTPTDCITSSGKMGDGIVLDGTDDYLKSPDATGKIDLTADWSMEAWIDTSKDYDGTIIFIGDDDDLTGEDEFSWSVTTNGEMQICHDGCVADEFSSDRVTTTAADLTTSKWYHVAITWDSGSNKVDVWVNNERVHGDLDGVIFEDNPATMYVLIGESDFAGDSDATGHGDFQGKIDDVRIVNYQRFAFGGGLMLSNVNPTTDSVTIYNAAGSSIELDGIELWRNGVRCGVEITHAGLASGTGYTFTAGCDLNGDSTDEADETKDALTLVDADMDNDGTDSGSGQTKAWIIDGVCWNEDDSSIDGDCNQPSDGMIAAGVWEVGTAIEVNPSAGYINLKISGNNDEAVSDWESIPEFSTLLMPIASVLLIVGYNYRRKNISEA